MVADDPVVARPPDTGTGTTYALSIAATGHAHASTQQQVLRDLLDAGAPCEPREVLAALHAHVGRADRATVDRARDRLRALAARMIVVGDADYPAHLRDAWPELGAPAWIFVAGQRPPAARQPTVAVVGTRAPSLDGARTARTLAAALGEAGVVVVSGLARGIDQAAHRAALDAGGPTVAVLGTGLGVDYPARTTALRTRIGTCGALITELLPGIGPRPWQFLARNRIISGLADATVVVEGRATSGALQTARLAGGQGRDVWAVPGSINAPTSAAPLALLRDGALPLTSIDDFVDQITDRHRWSPGPGPDDAVAVPPDLSVPASRLLSLLGAVPASADALATAGTLPARETMVAVAELVDRGLAAVTPHGVVRA